MAAAWWRSWRSRFSTTAHGGSIPAASAGTTTHTPSSAGTTTTTYTPTTADSRESNTCTPSSASVVILPPPSFHELGEEERVKKRQDIKALVVRFQSDRSAPERWLSDLEVDWVLLLARFNESGWRMFISGKLLYFARTWILALFKITRSISMSFGGRGISEKDGPPASEFIRFFEAALSKMLPFVDAIVAARTCVGTNDRWGPVEPADEKLQALILLRNALSAASAQIMLSSSEDEETRDFLSADQLTAKLDGAIWDTMEETKAGFMSSSLWSWGTPRSSDIHPITRFLISYIKVLWVNYGSANRILHDAFLRGESVPDNESACHLTNLTKEMLHSFKQKLTSKMQSTPWDKSLELLFLINNFHFIHQQLQQLPNVPPMIPDQLAAKIEEYIDSYIQASWAPVLKCLHNPTPRCFIIRRKSPLTKFESNFQITYTAQKFWKIPDVGMRKRLREAIVEEVIPGFTEFLKDNTLSTPSISPQEMKRMLQEVFEG